MYINEQDKKFATELLDKMVAKITKTADIIGDRMPRFTDKETGEYVYAEEPYSAWEAGFWPGMMWLMYLKTKNDKFKAIAESCEEKQDMAIEKFTCLHHDVGFMWLPSAVANYRITGNTRSKERGLHVAATLAARFNPVGCYIRAWNHWGSDDNVTRAIIDCMMNTPLLYWASEETDGGAPYLATIANLHADTVIDNFIRPDGSSEHMVVFDRETGEAAKKPHGQGYAEGSSWTRGQSWAVYGFVLSYIHTGNEEYLNTAKKVADYFISSLDETCVPPVDFRQPLEPHRLDTSAGAITACGLIEISKLMKDEAEAKKYMDWAMKIIRGLANHCDFTDDNLSILQMSNGAYHTPKMDHVSLIYGDYYLLEALMKLDGNEILFW